MPILVPPLDEQQRIADFLDVEAARIDGLATRRARQLELLVEYDRSVVSKFSDALIREHGFVRLRHVLTSIEQGWSPQCEDRAVRDGEWGVIKAGCVNGGWFDSSQHKALPVGVTPRTEYRLHPGDLLMSRASGSRDLIGSVGVVRQIESNLLLCDKIYRLRVDQSQMRVNFVAEMLRTVAVREHIKLGISGADGMANNLPTAVVKDCLLPKAPLYIQDSVVQELNVARDSVNATRAAINRQATLLAERRQALITAAVTGQISVSTASGRGVTEGVLS
jgi:type I restriction enzyme S subunit